MEHADHNIIELRQELRKKAIAARDRLSPENRHEWSLQIFRTLHSLVQERRFGSIHCYISVRSEVETRNFIELMISEHVHVTVPIVEQKGTSKVLEHTEITNFTTLAKGHFGLDEPTERVPASLMSLDAIIIPLVSFDRTGTRLGYGMGFYDRFVEAIPTTVERIGLGFSMQEVSLIPRLTHDQPLDLIVTEKEIIHVR